MRALAPRTLALAGLVAATAILGPPLMAAGGGDHGSAADEQPNFILITTDDLEVRSVAEMRATQRLLGGEGISFENSFVSFPLCCPSRATGLTGQYAHNHHVRHNTPPTGSFLRFDSSNTLPLWLQAAGYYTAHIGKYLLYYEQTPALLPAGWDGWWTLTGCSDCRPVERLQHVHRYYGYRLNENGALVDYGNGVADYVTDVLGARTTQVIRERAAAAQPFFIAFSPLAPHGGNPQPSPHGAQDCIGGGVPIPAPRHATAFDDAPLPQRPSFNEADVSDKPASIQSRPQFTQAQVAQITTRWRCRLESLLALDEAVEDIIATLEETGELDNTYVIFTSDNGFFFGEHRIPTEKLLLYEEGIRVPLLIRGPGIEPETKSSELVSNVDLARTIVEAAGATPGLPLDGLSLLEIARRPRDELGRDILLETVGVPPAVGGTGIRNGRYAYFEHETGERELYDLRLDPDQLDSRHLDPAYAGVVESLSRRLAEMRTCAGAACSAVPELALRIRPSIAGRCTHRDLRVSLSSAVEPIDELEVFLRGRKVGGRSNPPYRLRVDVAKLPVSKPRRLRLVAELADGRRRIKVKGVRACRDTRRDQNAAPR